MSGAPARELDALTVTPNPALDWDLTVPSFTPNAVNRVADDAMTPGGKGVNVAAALAEHGHRVAVTGLLGERNAEPFEALFADKGVRDHFVRVPGATRVGIKLTDPTTQHTTDVNLAGRAVAADALARLLAEVHALAAGVPWVVLAGSLPPGVPPTFYRDLLAPLAVAGCRVVVDASGEALRHVVDDAPPGMAPALLKPNRHELEALLSRSLPATDDVVAAARVFVAHGVELVAVSLGEEGALFVEREETVLARPPRVTVRTTVGAGDAMVAGIVAGRLRGLPLPEVARLATASAVDAITRSARNAAIPGALEALAARVEVERLA